MAGATALVAAALVPALTVSFAMARAGSAPAQPPAQLPAASLPHVGTWRLPPADLRPDDVAVGPGGEVFVADATARRLYIYDLSGAFRGQWDAPPGWSAYYPVTVRVAAGADVVYALWQYWTARGTEYALEARSLAGDLLLARNPRLGPRIDDMVVADTGVIYVLGGALIHVIEHSPENLLKVSELRPGGSAADATRLAVLGDGRFVYTRPDARRVYLSTGRLSTPPVVWDLSPLTPRDVAVTEAGIHVLVSSTAAGPEPPLVLTLDTTGTVTASVKASELGMPLWTGVTVPLALDAGTAGHAISTSSTHRFVHGFIDQNLTLSVRGFPTTVSIPDAWPVSRMDLSGFDGDTLITLDPLANPPAVLSVDVVSGTVRSRTTVAPGSRGTVAAGGTVYMSPSDPAAEIARIDPSGVPLPLGIACECSLGGALAIQADALYVTRPRAGTVAAYDLGTGTNLGSIQLPDARGLWPTDIALTSSGRLLTADPVSAEVQIWASAGEPSALWSGGSGGGSPRRIAVGNLADGTEVVGALMSTGRFELRTTADGAHVFGGIPDLSGGAQPAFDDLAVRDGALYVGDPGARAIHAFELPAAVPPPLPKVEPTPSAAHCVVSGEKVAGPRRIVLGEQAAVTLTLRAECTPRTDPAGADIVLVIDQDYTSGPCRHEPWVGALLELEVLAARRLLEGLDVRYHRVGLVAAGPANTPSVVAPTDDVGDLVDALAALDLVENPPDLDPDARVVPLLEAADELLMTRGRPDALPVVVFMSPDGGVRRGRVRTGTCPDIDALRARTLATGLQMRNRGVQIFTVYAVALPDPSGTPPDAEWLGELAGSPARHFSMKTLADIDPLVRTIHALIQELAATSLAGSLFIIDELHADVVLIADTVAPPALEGGGSLTWRRSLLPSSGLTMTYQVRPTRIGDVPTNLLAFAEFTDVDGTRRRFDYPVPHVEVVGTSLYLPVALKQECVAPRERVDVVLVVDASGSMDEVGLDGRTTKIEAARAAAGDFVNLLRPGNDRAGLLSFNADVTVVHPLSEDLAAVAQATSGIGTAPGTRLHLGVQAADEMLAERTGATRAMVVLSDGRSDPDPPELAVVAARAASEHGITVFAVALGRNADEETLAAMVSQPSHLRRAVDGSDLAGIYADLARELPCGR